jgi:hypothetical protein
MSNGVYVLVTKDGYRVAYGEDYDSLFGTFNDTDMNYNPNSDVILALFGKSRVFADEKSVLQAAFDISKRIDETDDGIMFVNNYPNFTFEELISGNKTA